MQADLASPASTELRQPRRRRRAAWGIAAAVVTVLAFAGGVEWGASRAVSDLASQAAQLREQGQQAQSIGVDQAVAHSSGPWLVFSQTDINVAASEAQQTMVTWATALGARGDTDAAIALLDTVSEPGMHAQVARERASLLIAAAQTAASRGDYLLALRRFDELGGAVPSDLEAQVSALRPAYEVAAAQQDLAAAQPADAVILLDDVLTLGSPAASSKAQSLLPSALLAAGQADLAAGWYSESSKELNRLVNTYPGTTAARTAARLLARPQPVSGTIVHRDGSPFTGLVRLSSHYTAVGHSYVTSGPFYYGQADASGDFEFSGIPQGGPYVLEVYDGGQWSTLVDQTTGQPTDPVTVTPLTPVDMAYIVLP